MHNINFILSSAHTVICDAGFEVYFTPGLCEPCRMGYWKDARSIDLCQLCPEHLVTNGTGATSEAECNLGKCDFLLCF